MSSFKDTREVFEDLEVFSAWIGETDVAELDFTIDLVASNFLGTCFIWNNFWLLINDIIGEFASNPTLSDGFKMRCRSSQSERAKDDTKHDSDDGAPRILTAEVEDFMSPQIAAPIEGVGVEPSDDAEQHCLTESSGDDGLLLRSS